MENQNEKKSGEPKKASRRNFLKLGLITGGVLGAGGIGLNKLLSKENETPAGTDTTVFTPDGKVYTANSSHLHKHHAPAVTNTEARTGIAGKKFVMVIDIAKCDGCKLCTQACQAMHFAELDREWIKVYKMKDAEHTTPYYFPKPCFHCDNPPCTKVCPVNATFKRQDGIVLVDNERCIGCRSCMAACPYSARYFNWSRPGKEELEATANIPCSPETSLPRRVGTVEKCDFCPDMLRQGKMPACVTGCAMDAVYFGDQNEDAVTNASGETLKLSQLLEDRAGYRYLEDLGTEPRVYYLPPKNRKYPPPEESEIDHPVCSFNKDENKQEAGGEKKKEKETMHHHH